MNNNVIDVLEDKPTAKSKNVIIFFVFIVLFLTFAFVGTIYLENSYYENKAKNNSTQASTRTQRRDVDFLPKENEDNILSENDSTLIDHFLYENEQGTIEELIPKHIENLRIFPGIYSLSEFRFEEFQNGIKRKLCTIDFPDNYYYSITYADSSGKTKTVIGDYTKAYKDVIDDGYIIKKMVAVQHSNKDKLYYIEFDDNSLFDNKSLKNNSSYADHPSFAIRYDDKDSNKILNGIIYQVNSQWTISLFILTNDEMSMTSQEIAQDFYSIINPFNNAL